MSTIIPGVVTLTPIAAVDTSTASSGVSMFTLSFPSDVIGAGNIIQFEYWVSNSGTPLPAVLNGFIPLEDAVTTQGISNQCTIAIPSSNNVFNPTNPLEVKVRVYVGQTITNAPEIKVSNWSNDCPLHNAPPQPGTPAAFLIRGEFPPTYYYTDVMYVQIPDNTSYVQGEIDFIISYSYKDEAGDYQWVVSTPLSNWQRYTFTNSSQNTIVLPEISLPADVDHASPVYVAVNAVYNYTFNSNNYYSVSEISVTIQATEGGFSPPVLSPIVIPDDYLVYSNPSNQQILLEWTPPTSSVIPFFTVASYTIELKVGGVVVDTVSDIQSNILNYTYDISSTYVNASTTTLLQFNVKAIFSSGKQEISNDQTVNTFKYATAPQNLVVNWANQGTNSTVDLELQFNNPSSNGFGTVINFVAQILSNEGAVRYSKNITYVAGSSPYLVYFNDVTSTVTGSVNVYMVNADTNRDSSGVYEPRNGAVSIANYILSELPFFTNIQKTDSSLSFDVISSTGLVNQNIFTFPRTASNPLDVMYFTSLSGTHQQYTVTQSTLETDDFKWSFVFEIAFFGSNIFPGNMICAISNQYGIGYGRIL